MRSLILFPVLGALAAVVVPYDQHDAVAKGMTERRAPPSAAAPEARRHKKKGHCRQAGSGYKTSANTTSYNTTGGYLAYTALDGLSRATSLIAAQPTLQSFCSNILGYTIPVVTVTATSNLLVTANVTSTAVVTGTVTSTDVVIATETFTDLITATNTLDAVVTATDTSTMVVSALSTLTVLPPNKRDISTPSALLTFPASVVTSACSLEATPVTAAGTVYSNATATSTLFHNVTATSAFFTNATVTSTVWTNVTATLTVSTNVTATSTVTTIVIVTSTTVSIATVTAVVQKGCYNIRSAYDGKNIAENSVNMLEQQTASGSTSQIWYIDGDLVATNNNPVHVQNMATARWISGVNGNGQMITAPSLSGDITAWLINLADPVNLPNNFYMSNKLFAGQVWDIYGGWTGDGVPIINYPWHGASGNAHDNQNWNFVPVTCPSA